MLDRKLGKRLAEMLGRRLDRDAAGVREGGGRDTVCGC